MAEITNSFCFITTQNNISKASTKLFEPKKADTEMKGVGLDQAYLCTPKKTQGEKKSRNRKLKEKSYTQSQIQAKNILAYVSQKYHFIPKNSCKNSKLSTQVKKPLQFLAISRPLN